jgi:hypothetical protein
MAIKNYKCLNCSKVKVCKVNDTLAKIAEESDKKSLGVDVTMESCENYSPDKE